MSLNAPRIQRAGASRNATQVAVAACNLTGFTDTSSPLLQRQIVTPRAAVL